MKNKTTIESMLDLMRDEISHAAELVDERELLESLLKEAEGWRVRLRELDKEESEK